MWNNKESMTKRIIIIIKKKDIIHIYFYESVYLKKYSSNIIL